MALGAALVIAWGTTLSAVHFGGSYGYLVFLATPFFLGFVSSLIYGLQTGRKIYDKSHFRLGVFALLLYAAGLLLFAFEGAICIIMAAPLAIPFAIAGSLVAVQMMKSERSGIKAAAMALLIYPSAFTMDLAHRDEAGTREITTVLEVDAPASKVWNTVVAFPSIPEPTEWLFRAGIAYPTHADIAGSGVGAVRNCHFSTGSFVEPVTVWEPPYRLEFDVSSQPDPMTELTVWKIRPPHLDGYFRSSHGRFLIVPLGENRCRLEGTTWYAQRIYPEAYWTLWTDAIIHRIHERVLRHIKISAEA